MGTRSKLGDFVFAGPDGPESVFLTPYLDFCHSWVATWSPGSFRKGDGNRCRVRIFHNGSLGRAFDWVVLISDNGDLARLHLTQLAVDIKRLHLARIPEEQIAWFYHSLVTLVDRVTFSLRSDRPDAYSGFCLWAVPIEQLEIAAGGLVLL